MAQRTLGRVLAAVALAAALTLALPAQADAAPAVSTSTLWNWLNEIATFWMRPTRNVERTRGKDQKAGVCIDPNGCATPPQALETPQRPACLAWNEAGVCIDPNG